MLHMTSREVRGIGAGVARSKLIIVGGGGGGCVPTSGCVRGGPRQIPFLLVTPFLSLSTPSNIFVLGLVGGGGSTNINLRGSSCKGEEEVLR